MTETTLAAGDLIVAVVLASPVAGKRVAYKRAIGRAPAEWRLVKFVASVNLQPGIFKRLRVLVGGVAPVALRLHAGEAAALANPPPPRPLQTPRKRPSKA